MKTGIYGGTFNPIHNGHLHIVGEFRKGLGLDRVLLIPTGTPPHKAAPNLAAPADRLAMCRLAVGGAPWLEVSDIETRRRGKSYTADTLEELAASTPRTSFSSYGGGHVPHPDRWYRADTIFRLAAACASPRSRDGMEPLRQKALDYTARFGARCFLEHIPYLPISSTQVRQAAAAGRAWPTWSPAPCLVYPGKGPLSAPAPLTPLTPALPASASGESASTRLPGGCPPARPRRAGRAGEGR